MKDSAQLVVVGAGMVGCSVAYHLAQLGWSDVIVLDAGPLEDTGGSTGHAPGVAFAVHASRTMARFAVRTMELARSLGGDAGPCFDPVGGLELATTEERWQDAHRRLGLARAWGIDAELLSPGATRQLSPLLDASRILGALYTPGDGIVRGGEASAAMRRLAEERGVVFQGNTEVTGIEIKSGRVTAVAAGEHRIRCEQVLCAAGVWGPLIGRMAGVPIPLVPCEHLYAVSEPLADLADEPREVAHAVVRHLDGGIYLRQEGARYGVGSFDHEPLTVEPEALATPGGAGAPARLRFTPEHFESARRALEALYPAIGRARLQESFNGLLACTPDGLPILGPSSEVKGLWAGEAVWITHAGGVGQALANWIATGDPEIDVHEVHIERFHPHQTTRPYVRATGKHQYRHVYAIRHPREPVQAPRGLRRSPFHQRLEAMGASFFESGGWERPRWLESNAGLLARNRPSRSGWAARHWSPVEGAEHRHVRERVALFDLTPSARIEVQGIGALAFLQRLASCDLNQPSGRVLRTLLLNPHGGIEADPLLVRLGRDRFLLSGEGDGTRELAWLRRHAPDDGSVQIRDVTSCTCALGLWGPRARDVLQAVTEDDVSGKAFPDEQVQRLTIGYVPALVMRTSPVGELGWVIHAPVECGVELWDRLWRAGEDHQMIAAGLGAFDSLRLEKGQRVWGAEIDAETDPLEAGLGWAVDLEKDDFVGREAVRRTREAAPRRRLCCLTLDEPDAVLLGKEPIAHNARVVGHVTSSNYGYSIDKPIAYGWLPIDHAQPGSRVEIESFGRRQPATVAKEPLFDPQGRRLKA